MAADSFLKATKPQSPLVLAGFDYQQSLAEAKTLFAKEFPGLCLALEKLSVAPAQTSRTGPVYGAMLGHHPGDPAYANAPEIHLSLPETGACLRLIKSPNAIFLVARDQHGDEEKFHIRTESDRAAADLQVTKYVFKWVQQEALMDIGRFTDAAYQEVKGAILKKSAPAPRALNQAATDLTPIRLDLEG